MKAYATYLPDQTMSENMKWICISPSSSFKLFHLTVIDGYWYVQTDKDAVNSKIGKVKLNWTRAKALSEVKDVDEQSDFIDVIPEQMSKDLIMGLMIDIDKTLLLFVEGGMQAIYLYDLFTEKEMGRVLVNETFSDLVQFSSSKQANMAFLTYSGITFPRKIYEAKYDQQTQQVTTSIITSRFVDGTDPIDIISQHVSLPTISGIGTKENSYTIFSKETMAENATMPAWMHINPNVDQSSYLWSPQWYYLISQFDGCLIWVNVDIGFDDDGQLRFDQESIDKIKAVAQDVIKRKFVAPGKLILEGKGEAGMAAAIALNQSPENTFGVLLVEDGIFDIFLFERMLNNSNLSGKIDMDQILHFSPLQNINKTFQRYPATLITSQKDDPTFTSQSMKYIAQLQNSYSNNSLPMLLLLKEKYKEELIDQQCFLQLVLDWKGQDDQSNMLGTLSTALNG